MYRSKREREEEEGADELKEGTLEVLLDVREEAASIKRHVCRGYRGGRWSIGSIASAV